MSKVKDHTAAECLLLNTFNKIRANKQLPSIIIKPNLLEAVVKKEPVKAEQVAKDLAKEVKDLKAILKGFEGRLQVVEKLTGTKWKADSTPLPPSPKKRKMQHKQNQATQQVQKPPTSSGGLSKKGKKKAT